jgi:hypothetical protein
MISHDETTDSHPPAERLTLAQRAESRQKAAERSLTKLGHAIDFLNNHLPAFGFKQYMGDEPWKTGDDGPPLMMGDVPPEIAREMERAMVNAARFAGDYFAEDIST